MRMSVIIFGFFLSVSASSRETQYPLKGGAVIPLNDSRSIFNFRCVHETLPESSVEVNLLFNYARWLQISTKLDPVESITSEIERLYRIASENGHIKANINLQNGALRSQFHLKANEQLRMSQQLISENVATGYLLIGFFLRDGVAGLAQDPEMALRYIRKAAEEGNAQAQYEVGEKLAPIRIAPEVARQLRTCAAKQGHGKAARSLGVNLSTKKLYGEAMEAFQLGIAAGDSISASFMSKGFLGPSPQDRLHYLGQHADTGRADRYMKVWNILSDYSFANPNVPEINDIIPLPPADLPEWDGKLQWLETYLANVPPEKPSEALITRLAEAKGLDPLTGKPLPGSPAFSQEDLYPRRSYTGELCPTSGYWTNIELFRECAVDGPIARYIEKGEVMPPLLMRHYKRRHWPWSDKITEYVEPVEWKLV